MFVNKSNEKMPFTEMKQKIMAICLVVCLLFTGVAEFGDVRGESLVSGDATASGDATVSGDATASGDATKYILKAEPKIGESIKASGLSMGDIVLETLDDAKNAAIKDTKGSSKTIYKAVQSKWILGTTNISQGWMNAKYKKEYPKQAKLTGTCSEISATILTEYYNRKKRCVILPSAGRMQQEWFKPFANYIETAKSLGIYPADSDGGTCYEYRMTTPFYKKYNKSMKSIHYTKNVSDKIEELHNKAIPVIGGFTAPNGDGHSMVIAGYYDITVKYKKKGKNTYSYITYRYYTVNDGWQHCTEGNKRIQYVRRQYLDKSIYQIASK